MPTLYLRTDPDAHVYLTRLAGTAGVSISAVVGAIIREAMRLEWDINVPSPAQVVQAPAPPGLHQVPGEDSSPPGPAGDRPNREPLKGT